MKNMTEKMYVSSIIPCILRIIEGGLSDNKEMIKRYADKLADHCDDAGNHFSAKCIREKLYSGNLTTMDENISSYSNHYNIEDND